MRANCDITIYNKYTVAREERYKRTVVRGVLWENRKGSNVIQMGSIEADSVRIFIPFSKGTYYLPPASWKIIAGSTSKWTLKPGDFIVRNAVPDIISNTFTMADLKEKYDDVVRITSVDRMDVGSSSMQHWEIGAK